MTTHAARLARRLELLEPLTLEDQRALQDAATAVRRLEARDDLAIQGAPLPGLFGIREGFACRYKLLPDGRRQIVALLLPGDLCDPRELLLPQLDHSIAALGPAEILIFSRESVQKFEQMPRLARALICGALVHQAIARQWMLNVGHRSAFERIAHLVCEIHARLSAVGLAQDGMCPAPLTQIDLADTVAITPVHVNRTLMELKRMGLLTFHSKRLVIHDLPALHRAASFDPGYLQLLATEPAHTG